MDGHEDRTVGDEALSREIEAALGVDPSPEFLPRIRARLADGHAREGWLWSAPWRWAGAAAVLAAVAILGVWTLHEPAPVRQEARVWEAPALEASRPGLAASPVESPRPVRPAVVRTVQAQRREAVESAREVVISPDEAAALRQLVVAISARHLNAADIPKLGEESAPLPPIEEIVLEPIELSPMTGLEGE